MIVGVDPARVELDVIPPLDWLLVRLDPRIEQTEGGLAVPSTVTPPARTGVLIARGDGALSDDGKTRMPKVCDIGDRILFERAAGKGLPRVPRETTERSGWGYLLIREGSVCSLVEPGRVSPDRQRALDAGAGGVPARPDGSLVPVSRRGAMCWDRLLPVQDWLVVRMDERQEQTDMLVPVKQFHRANGRSKPVFIHEKEPEEKYDLWSGEVLRRGPGLVTVTRCLDGDRMGEAPRIAEEGGRVLFAATHPHAAPIYDEHMVGSAGAWQVQGEHREFLMREYPCVCARLAS